MPDIYGLILAGGSGVRLWPRSREELPKQFLSLRKGDTMLQDTVMRMLRVAPVDFMYAVAGGRWSALVAYQAREVARVPDDFVIEEPVGRNTAPAILLGCEALRRRGASKDDVVVVTPSDHIVSDVAAFDAAIARATAAASAGYMVMLGITPTHPETGFGYIKRGAPLGDCFEVERFVEKPDPEAAESYVQSGEYFWNSGIFVFTLETFERELERTSPDLFAAFGKDYDAFLEEFETLPSISFDCAVMEKAERVAMVELDAGWSDVGSWDALYDVLKKDGFRNVRIGDVMLQDSKNCLVDSRNHLTAMIDVEDLLVVDSPDALLIARRGSSQKVRTIVERLKTGVRREATQATESARPWGRYKILCEEERFKIKRIVINPGKRLSLQYHHHRSEHWIVVRGTALITLDENERFVHEGESVFIPRNALHRLENPGKIDLEIVEVQGGEYLGEDDIVRVDDDYRRTCSKSPEA
ncbi:MAG: mannose-1-phosphate guanylyltransferase/mannose-6-phosphate isomerase [Synergistaceae bacterium]|jgi:mannose-1-phosphate guanylyltransferase/mannose-6-phosphate isomerase|nr:mannose-1-phosphate guanylyltransferase/mannose-6-phosphate isomerase [Synergistaceae bacterium]